MLNKLCRMCKCNFAACIAYVAFHLFIFNVNASLISRSELTIHLDISHYTAYFILHCYRRNRHRDETEPQARTLTPPRITQSATQAGSRTVVSIGRVLRCPRFAPDEVRNAAPRAYRWRLQSRGCRPIWPVASDPVSGRSGVLPRGPGRSIAQATWPQRGAQTHRRGHALYRATTTKRWLDSCACVSARDRIQMGSVSSPSQHRTRDRAQKKTVEEPVPACLSSAAVACYEALRSARLPGQGGREELTALRFHGMWQGLAMLLNAPAAPPNPPVPAHPVSCRDSEFVRLLANLVLHTHSELTHVC